MIQVQRRADGILLDQRLGNPGQCIGRVQREFARTTHQNHRRVKLTGNLERGLGDLSIPSAKRRAARAYPAFQAGCNSSCIGTSFDRVFLARGIVAGVVGAGMVQCLNHRRTQRNSKT